MSPPRTGQYPDVGIRASGVSSGWSVAVDRLLGESMQVPARSLSSTADRLALAIGSLDSAATSLAHAGRQRTSLGWYHRSKERLESTERALQHLDFAKLQLENVDGSLARVVSGAITQAEESAHLLRTREQGSKALFPELEPERMPAVQRGAALFEYTMRHGHGPAAQLAFDAGATARQAKHGAMADLAALHATPVNARAKQTMGSVMHSLAGGKSAHSDPAVLDLMNVGARAITGAPGT